MLNIYETGPAPRSKSLSIAGSAAIHFTLLLIVLQVRSPLESHLQRYSATQLYLPASAPPLAAAPVQRKPMISPSVRSSESIVAPARSALPFKPPAPTPIADLPAPPELSLPAQPELSMTRVVSTSQRPGILPPSPPRPQPPSPVFASALTAVAPSAHSVLRTESFASVPVTAAPVGRPKLPGVAGTFGAVPVETSRRATQPGTTHAAGFGETAVASPHSQEQAVQLKTAGTAFTAAVTADPARQPASVQQSVAQPLEIVFKPRPAYTEEARRARLEGDVVLEVLFTGSGNLRVLRVVTSLGYGLEQKAIDAAGKIRFRPAGADGHPIDTVAIVRISFQMAY